MGNVCITNSNFKGFEIQNNKSIFRLELESSDCWLKAATDD